MAGSETVGVGTARLSETVSHPLVDSGRFEFVWASAAGGSRGGALVPLHPRVPEFAVSNPPLYTALAAVDLIRVGGARERAAAMDRLRLMLNLRAT